MATPLQAPYAQFFDSNGDPLSGGKVYFYEAGTTTPKDTYTDAGGLTPAANPVVLDSSGRAAIWITGTYRVDVYTSADVLVRSVDSIPAFTAGGDMTKAVYDPANIAQQVVGTTAVQTLTNKTITLTGGSVSAAPLNFTSGTNLTSATAGSTEYDGKVEYFTPLGTQRGIVEAAQTIVLNSAVVGSNVNTAQSIFGKTVTLSSSTYYAFEGNFNFSKSAGASAHTVSLLFGGTATLNNIGYQAIGGNSTTSFIAGFGTIFMNAPQVATAAVTTSSISSANSFVTYQVRGVVSVNAGGTFDPQYILSAAPGGAYSTAVSSYFKISPLGASGANISVGTWA